MESRAKLFGHPIHPMLIVFPLGLLAVAVIFDIIGLTTGNLFWATMAYYLIEAGVIGGIAASIFGLVDYVAIPNNTRAKTIGLMHGAMNLIVIILFGGSWLLRREIPNQPSTMALTLSFVGVALALITSWLGGELVDRLGVGVDEGAHLDAPSSLSGRPAREQDTKMAAQSTPYRQEH